MRKPQQFYAGLELVLFFSVWFVNVWGLWRSTGASAWTAVGFIVLAGIVAVSIRLRRPDWTAAGFRLDNVGAALAHVALPFFLFAGLFVVVSALMGMTLQLASWSKARRMLISGVVQQAFFLGYLLPRWSALIANPSGAIVANALSFGLIHLPHLALTALTSFGGLFLGALFLRARNIFVLGLAHGLLSIFVVPTLEMAGILGSTRIGPPELSALAAEVAGERQPGERIGVGPHGVAVSQLGTTLGVAVERIGDSAAAEQQNADLVRSFLQQKERVFCLLSEEDFERYVRPSLRERVFLLGQHFIWKPFRFNQQSLRELFYGSGDVPLLAAFRQRVFLLSNKPSKKQGS